MSETTGKAPGGSDDQPPVDAADALAIISTGRRSMATTVPSGAFLFLLWGTVWTVGYGALWLSADDDGNPSGLAGLVAIALGIAGLTLTAVHVTRRTRGIAGASARAGAMYGWSWPIGFIAQALIVTALGRAGASSTVTSLAANSVAALVVGMMYLAGGILWSGAPMYVLGAWIALVGAGSALAGLPGSYLLMSLAGGGGMLVAGAVELLRPRGLRDVAP